MFFLDMLPQVAAQACNSSEDCHTQQKMNFKEEEKRKKEMRKKNQMKWVGVQVLNREQQIGLFGKAEFSFKPNIKLKTKTYLN